jgi:hypothetical protein
MRSPRCLLLSLLVVSQGIALGGGVLPAWGSNEKPPPGQFLRVRDAQRTVVLTLVAADTAENNGYNFDGYGRGELLVRVPRGWRVTVRFRNAGQLFDSCAVVAGPGATTVAFPGASTPAPLRGLPAGASASFSFLATRLGVFRFASVVPGHEQARMWDVLEVEAGGRPSISARPGP